MTTKMKLVNLRLLAGIRPNQHINLDNREGEPNEGGSPSEGKIGRLEREGGRKDGEKGEVVLIYLITAGIAR